ncbi:MAG: hypothetical protein WBD87_12815 [Candidatus Acidiferrales bacterium]
MDLIKIGTIAFPLNAPVLATENSKSDLKGNIYLEYTDSAQIAAQLTQGAVRTETSSALLPVRKLDLDSGQQIEYRAPSIPDYPDQLRASFNVSADGSFFLLVKAYHSDPYKNLTRPSFFIERFNEDGSFDSRTELAQPPSRYLNASAFGVFGDGTFLIVGTLSPAFPPRHVEAFAGLFSASGSFIKNVELGQPHGNNNPKPLLSPGYSMSHSSLLSAPDGSIYLIRDTNPLEVLVILPGGVVSKDVQLKIPVSGLSPTESGLIGPDLLYAKFSYIPTYPPVEKTPESLIATIDMNSEQFENFYHVPQPNNNMRIASDLSGHIFVLSWTVDNKLEVVKYAIR